MPASNGHTLRRSSRVPIHVPIRVTSLEPSTRFSGICETLVVSAHGCALRLPIKLDCGIALRFDSKAGRQTTAYVVVCQPMGDDGQGWRLGARLDHPGNFWGLESCPDDWRVLEMPAPADRQPVLKLPAGPAIVRRAPAHRTASQTFLQKLEEQLSEDRLQGILAKLVRPLQAEVSELREKLGRNARQNRFEVSLGHIPPELEAKLWERLREDLGAQVREQSTEILGSAKAAIEQKIDETLAEFRHRLAGELHTVERRAQVLSKEITSTAQQHAHAGVEKLQRQALDAEAQLNARSEKLLGSLQQRLADTHEAHRCQVEQIQAESAAKASQLQSEVADLSRRIATLNESVRRLESDLDAHLERLAGEIVVDAKVQLESAVALALKDLQTRGSNAVETRLDETCSHLRTIQNRIEDSFSGSLRSQTEQAVQGIEQKFDELAQQSVEKWRLALAHDLNTVANTLGQQLRRELESGTGIEAPSAE